MLTIGDNLYTDWNSFEIEVEKVLKPFNFKPSFIKNIIEKLSEHDETAEYVTDKKGNLKADSDLRDTQKIPVTQIIDELLEDEILKYYPDAWHDSKKDKIGYEINFTQYFYIYEPPRSLNDIENDINNLTKEIQSLLMEDNNGI